MPEMNLREYQTDAMQAVLSNWCDGHRSVIVALPPGMGKTRIGLALLQRTLGTGQRALWLAHRAELLDQPLERIQRHWPEVRVGIVKAEQDQVWADLVLGSVQTLVKPNRLRRLMDAGQIDYVVSDEAHHVAADGWRGVIDTLRQQNPDMLHLGLTATPQRSDGIGLDCVFSNIAYQQNIQRAIKGGWLCPVDGRQIETGVDISMVRRSRGDFVADDLADVLDAARWHELVATAYTEHAAGKQAMAFTPTVLTSKHLCAEFQERGIRAAHVDGTTPKEQRRTTVRQFRNQEIQVVTNCAVFGEGADFPSMEVVLMARPTQSHVLFTQIVGRALRVFPGKERALVLLFATTGARVLTLYDLGGSKALDEAREAAEDLGVEGVSAAIPLFDESKIEGVGVYATAVNLFASDDSAWFRDGATFTLGLGTGKDGKQRILVILPPNGSDEWQLLGLGRHSDKGPYRVIKMITESPDIDVLMEQAAGTIERWAVPVLAKKKNRQRWSKQPASAGQKGWIRKAGWAATEAIDRLTKGEAAQVITHGVAIDVLRRGNLL